MKRHLRRFTLLLLICPIVLLNCDMGYHFDWDGEDDGPNIVTHILEIRVEPNPVMAGDSLSFTCVISDSLVSGFYYQWRINVDSTQQDRILTGIPILKIKSYTTPGVYTGNVTVDHDNMPGNAVGASFEYEVIAP
jgi:hypothetical protein